MPQKAYKRRPPRRSRSARAVPPRPTIPEQPRGGFSLPRTHEGVYDPISVHSSAQGSRQRIGRVSGKREIMRLAEALNTESMHVIFFDHRLGQWLRIDWPEH